MGAELPSASAAQFGMIGRSPAMQQLLNEIAMVAPSDATVLIHGDSGTGKSWSPGRCMPAAPVAISRW
jgi:two-component system response regulator HydG